MKWFYLTLIVSFGFLNSNAQKTSPAPTSTHDGSTELPEFVYPSFPGGEKAFYKFLAANLKRPSRDNVQGRVFISFFVEKDGRLTGLKVERSLRKDFDDEALRVLRKSPEWIPPMKDGKALRLQYVVPINFKTIK